jgi:3-oxoacyl-[acyl-carrier protein] reductase
MFETVGGVDVLVCSAGIALLRQFQDTTAADWQRIMSVNLGGTVNCIRAALPHMLRNKFGRIVTVSSMWGVTGGSCESAYSASKAALIGLTRSLAKELGPSGITVNCVAPGVIATDMNADLTEEDLAALREETPLGTLGTPEDVAQAVRYLVSAPFVTGQVLGVNGGILI